jgi:hypothetical protein
MFQFLIHFRPLIYSKSGESRGLSVACVFIVKMDRDANISDITGAYNTGAMTPRAPQDSYYGGRASSYRPDSTYNRTDSYFDGAPANGHYPNRVRYPRTPSEPRFDGPYQSYQGNQPSYETVNSASGSGSSGQDAMGYQTELSSENSSFDRIQKENFGEPFNMNGAYQSNGYGGGGQYTHQNPDPSSYAQHSGPPAVPRKESAPQVPIKLGGTGGVSSAPTVYEPPRPEVGKKRKSWLSRKFSTKA